MSVYPAAQPHTAEHETPGLPLQSRYLMPITGRPPQVFVRGQGSLLWDDRGRRYLDFVQGWAVNTLGHCPPVVRQALAAQSATLLTPSPAYFNQPALNLAERIGYGSTLNQVFFANSGAEANEGAIKLARRFGADSGRYEIVTFHGGFHGRTLACMSASGKAAFDPLFEPKVPGFRRARLNDIDSVAAQITPATVAVMLEPVQGEAGVFEATSGFLQQLRTLTADAGLLLILDEIQTGVGRTGSLWCHTQAGITPDIMTLGKGLGAGVPISALVATEQASCFQPGDQGGTWCGNPLMCAVGDAVLSTAARPDFLARVVSVGAYLKERLQSLSSRHGLGDVRGRGLLLALDTGGISAPQVVDRALEEGLLVNAPRKDTLRFMPALNVLESEIDELVGILDEIFG